MAFQTKLLLGGLAATAGAWRVLSTTGGVERRRPGTKEGSLSKVNRGRFAQQLCHPDQMPVYTWTVYAHLWQQMPVPSESVHLLTVSPG